MINVFFAINSFLLLCIISTQYMLFKRKLDIFAASCINVFIFFIALLIFKR